MALPGLAGVCRCQVGAIHGRHVRLGAAERAVLVQLQLVVRRLAHQGADWRRRAHVASQVHCGHPVGERAGDGLKDRAEQAGHGADLGGAGPGGSTAHQVVADGQRRARCGPAQQHVVVDHLLRQAHSGGRRQRDRDGCRGRAVVAGGVQRLHQVGLAAWRDVAQRVDRSLDLTDDRGCVPAGTLADLVDVQVQVGHLVPGQRDADVLVDAGRQVHHVGRRCGLAQRRDGGFGVGGRLLAGRADGIDPHHERAWRDVQDVVVADAGDGLAEVAVVLAPLHAVGAGALHVAPADVHHGADFGLVGVKRLAHHQIGWRVWHGRQFGDVARLQHQAVLHRVVFVRVVTQAGDLDDASVLLGHGQHAEGLRLDIGGGHNPLGTRLGCRAERCH